MELPRAVIRRRPEDFVVEELPAYAPSGRGEHLFITLRKTGLTTPDAVRAIARALDVDPRGAGHAGMKDRHAVTTQTISLPFPIARAFEPAVAALSLPGVEVISAARHDHKLKPGHLAGNRFRIVLREVAPDDEARLAERLLALGRDGVPNAFGPQRFGRDGSNPERALLWLAGKERGPRDRRDQRLLFSALQSHLFNEVLGRRVDAGTWSSILPGDLAKKIGPGGGGLFAVPLAGPELEDARERALAGSVAPTGPMFGATMRWPEGEPLGLEREVLSRSVPDPARLDALRHLGEGTRRSLRMTVDDVAALGGGAPDRASDPHGAGVTVSFVLPKGGYATTVLACACRVVDVTRPDASAGAAEPEEPPE